MLDRLGLTAGSLTFTTLIALVPLVTVTGLAMLALPSRSSWLAPTSMAPVLLPSRPLVMGLVLPRPLRDGTLVAEACELRLAARQMLQQSRPTWPSHHRHQELFPGR